MYKVTGNTAISQTGARRGCARVCMPLFTAARFNIGFTYYTNSGIFLNNLVSTMLELRETIT